MKIAFFSMNRNFCGQILEELGQHHTVRVWQYNSNEILRWLDIRRLLDWCDTAYLEWLQHPNLEISHMQGLDKPLVAFCHGIDLMNHHLVDWNNVAGLILQDVLAPRLDRLREAYTQGSPNAKLPPLPKKRLAANIGVDLSYFTPVVAEPEYHIILHSMFIRPTKRIYTAIQQFYDLIQADGGKPWKMTVIGEWESDYDWAHRAEYVLACHELIDMLDFPPKRLFIKPENFPRDVWRSFLGTADVYWCPSWRESFGASMAEACAVGVYPLMNNFLGASLIYPDKYLCNTPGEMVRKTIEWGNLTKEAKMAEREAISLHIAKYDARASARRIREFLEGIVGEYRK